MSSIMEILRLSPLERAHKYGALGMQQVNISGNVFENYGTFSFYYAKTQIESPERGGNGSMDNINDHAFFLTPHLKINYGLMSIDDYRRMMKLIYSRNEHTVTCYDPIYDKITTNKMYFYPEEMPNLWGIVEGLQSGGEQDINSPYNTFSLIGVKDYVIEMVGTNNDIEPIDISYYLNAPVEIDNGIETVAYETVARNHSILVGENANIDVNGTMTNISSITFGNRYIFQYWCDKQDGTGFKYIHGEQYLIPSSTRLYAIWKEGAK